MESLVVVILIVGWLFPFLLTLFSERTHGGEKLAWLIVMLFISWFAWILYMALAPLKQNPYEEEEVNEVENGGQEPARNDRAALALALTVIFVLLVVWTNY